MFTAKNRRGVGATAVAGIVFDSEIRRAAAEAVPPLARLTLAIAKRMARQEARRLRPSRPRRRRRLASAGGAVALLAAALVLMTDADRRHKLQRLVVR